MVITFIRRFAKGDDLFQSERCGEIDLDNHVSARRELPCDTISKQILKALLLPDIVIISPSAAGPSKWPSWVPPVNFSLAEVGSSSDTITYTWRVTLPQQLILLKISTFSTRTSVP